MPTSTLCVLAGCRGAGKSTLLHKSLKENIPLFGEEYNDLFQKINPFEGSFSETLKQNGIFRAEHIPNLLKLDYLPKFLVMHLEITGILINSKFRQLFEMDSRYIRQKLPTSIESLSNIDNNFLLYSTFLNNQFFSKFSTVIINTLILPYETNMQQWLKRRQNKFKKNNFKLLLDSFLNPKNTSWEYLFNPKKPRPDIHQKIYDGWNEALTTKTNFILLNTKIENFINIKQI